MTEEIVTKVEYQWIWGACQSEYFPAIATTLTVAITIKIAVSIVLAIRRRKEKDRPPDEDNRANSML